MNARTYLLLAALVPLGHGCGDDRPLSEREACLAYVDAWCTRSLECFASTGARITWADEWRCRSAAEKEIGCDGDAGMCGRRAYDASAVSACLHDTEDLHCGAILDAVLEDEPPHTGCPLMCAESSGKDE